MSWETFQDRLPRTYSPSDIEFVRRAHERAEKAHGDQKRKSGEPYITHPEEVAGILADLRLDAATVAAALLHDVAEDTVIAVSVLENEFGPEVGLLVNGVTKFKVVQDKAVMETLPLGRRDVGTESLRKLFLAMGKDVRVVFIKLADRLHNMRTLQFMPNESQRRIARETLDIYAPLADRLGIYRIKWELEDLAFKFLDPETYEDISHALAQHQEEREAFIQRMSDTLRDELSKNGIQATIKSRPQAHLQHLSEDGAQGRQAGGANL